MEPRRRARAYVGGLLAPVARKHGWQLAAMAGDRTPDGVQDLRGPRLYDWVYLPYRADTAPGWQTGLLLRRQGKRPAAFTCYLTLAPAGTTLAALVRVAGTRWTVEACFVAAKDEVGLDQYEVGWWTGGHRPITWAMLAYAYLAVLHQLAMGKNRTGSRNRAGGAAGATAAHCARAAPAAVVPGVGASAHARTCPGLVGVAASPPAARPPRPLVATDALQ